jgi:membrane protein required for colicin V production
MNLLDIAIIATMILLVVRGIFRGVFREIGSLGGVVLGIWLANLYQADMTAYLKDRLPAIQFLPLISFILIFAIVFVSSCLMGWGLHMIFKKIFFGWADRSLGAGLAVLKGILITYLAIVLLTFFLPSKAPLIAESRISPVIVSSYQFIVGMISPGAHERWKQKFIDKKVRMDGLPSGRILHPAFG